MAKGHHLHGGLLDQEKWVIAAAVAVFFGYAAFALFAEGSARGVFSGDGNFFSEFGSLLFDVWRMRLLPIFVVLDIFLVLTGLYALIRVWPLRQNIKLFRLKPGGHGHGHEAHGHTHETHGAAHGASSSAHEPTSNPATLKHWAAIVHRANTGTPENLRWAVLEADALIDMVLRQRGIAGETMADRLQNARWAGSKLIDRVFDAHRLRNEIAHTPGFVLSTKQAERALFTFRDFLKELKEF